MVLQKRLDYGFNGYQVPSTPRATRSARRSSFKKKAEDNQLCPFDLLATVAGNLLLQNGSSLPDSNASTYECRNAIVQKTMKKEQSEDEQQKVGLLDISCSQTNITCSSNEFPHPLNDGHLGIGSVIPTSDLSHRLGSKKLVIDESKIELGIDSSKVGIGMAAYRESVDCILEDKIKIQIKDTKVKTGKIRSGIGAEICNLEDPLVCDEKPAALLSSDSDAKAPMCINHIAHDSLTLSRGYVKLVSRDDDENSSGSTRPRTTNRSSKPPYIGDRRIRRLMASRHWKAAPRLKDERFWNTDEDIKPVYQNRINCYKHQSSQRNYPFKKRRFLYNNSVSGSAGGIRCEGISNAIRKGINVVSSRSDMRMRGARRTSSSTAGAYSSFQAEDTHVKLSIKSFRIPELFIEIPETETVGSLKRTVMEAVTAILGGGLHVGVVLQGKKVKDDNKTLLQTGISHKNQTDALGFTLEPKPLQTSKSLCHVDSPLLLPSDITQPITRYPPSSTIVHQGTDDSFPKPHVATLSNFIESEHDSAPSPTDMSNKDTKNSNAMVAVPSMSVEALAVVPVHPKPKRSEMAQRRIRRPFSVTEVEALVQAVEKLGTGRWRDVKLRSFDNQKHRTYVDLKDKWKTLVHTARISPQQRRGEPVPQELLDRVLTAHAYWSQQAAKQQLIQQTETCFLPENFTKAH